MAGPLGDAGRIERRRVSARLHWLLCAALLTLTAIGYTRPSTPELRAHRYSGEIVTTPIVFRGSKTSWGAPAIGDNWWPSWPEPSAVEFQLRDHVVTLRRRGGAKGPFVVVGDSEPAIGSQIIDLLDPDLRWSGVERTEIVAAIDEILTMPWHDGRLEEWRREPFSTRTPAFPYLKRHSGRRVIHSAVLPSVATVGIAVLLGVMIVARSRRKLLAVKAGAVAGTGKLVERDDAKRDGRAVAECRSGV